MIIFYLYCFSMSCLIWTGVALNAIQDAIAGADKMPVALRSICVLCITSVIFSAALLAVKIGLQAFDVLTDLGVQ